jgi:hypothetical protein
MTTSGGERYSAGLKQAIQDSGPRKFTSDSLTVKEFNRFLRSLRPSRKVRIDKIKRLHAKLCVVRERRRKRLKLKL